MVSNGYILLAGGDAPRRQALRRVYSPRYGILEADDGRTALDLLTGEAPGLRGAFLGLDTPGLDGCGVLAGLARRGLARRLPVFILDSGAEPALLDRCWKLGAADILRDPEAEPARSRTETVLALSRRPPAPQGEDSGEGSWPPAAATAAQAICAALEARDAESGGHVGRVGAAAGELLRTLAPLCPEYGLTDARIRLVSQAAALHDAGKLSTPDSILRKPGRLTREELALVRRHPLEGCRILESVPALRASSVYPYCYQICRWHHERWDGGGYPDGLRGDAIPIWAQAAALADVYDALVSPRVYHDPRPHGQAVDMILSGQCGAFGPRLSQALQDAAPRLESLYAGA